MNITTINSDLLYVTMLFYLHSLLPSTSSLSRLASSFYPFPEPQLFYQFWSLHLFFFAFFLWLYRFLQKLEQLDPKKEMYNKCHLYIIAKCIAMQRLEMLLYVKSMKSNQCSWNYREVCHIFVFILLVIAISIPGLALVIDYLWVISKWLKQHLFVHNFTNPEDICHMFDNRSCTTDTTVLGFK